MKINRLLLLYRNLEESSERERKRSEIQKALKKLNDSVLNIMMSFDTEVDNNVEGNTAPRNVGVILLDIRRTHARHKVVRNSIDKIENEFLKNTNSAQSSRTRRYFGGTW